MDKLKNRRGSQAAPALLIAALISVVSLGSAGAQIAVEAQGTARRASEEPAYFVTPAQAVWSMRAESAQVPQDIRIMQRIVHTALGEVETPELPDALEAEADPSVSHVEYDYAFGDSGAAVWLAGKDNGVYNIGSRDVTGFYMQGYGYLFTVKWRVMPGGVSFMSSGRALERAAELSELASAARRAAATTEAGEARAADEAERALEQESARLGERQAAWDEWSAQYRDMLTNALRDVVATYGSTLKRAAPEESITFMADFGGGEDEMVSLSALRGDLAGANRDENVAAVRMAKGETGVSDALGTELKIMAEIIGSSLQVVSTGDLWVAYSGSESSYQYVPGYGVLFRKAARLNIATHVIRQVNPDRIEAGVTVQSLRQQIDESTEEQREAYTAHLADLKEKTAEILATYGPTLTEMNDNDWVGIFYDVGSAAGLLEGGIANFLVQARMGDVRQAGGQVDGAAWLLGRLVTNEKQE